MHSGALLLVEPSPSQIGDRAAAPTIQKEDSGYLVCHIVVDRNDVDAGGTEGFEHVLAFVFEYSEVAIDHGVHIVAGRGARGLVGETRGL